MEPCCAGSGEESDEIQRGGDPADVDVLLHVLTQLDGATPRENLLNWFALRTNVSLDRAAEVLERAKRSGRVRQADDVVMLRS